MVIFKGSRQPVSTLYIIGRESPTAVAISVTGSPSLFIWRMTFICIGVTFFRTAAFDPPHFVELPGRRRFSRATAMAWLKRVGWKYHNPIIKLPTPLWSRANVNLQHSTSDESSMKVRRFHFAL
jgi:hypothetical protein